MPSDITNNRPDRKHRLATLPIFAIPVVYQHQLGSASGLAAWPRRGDAGAKLRLSNFYPDRV